MIITTPSIEHRSGGRRTDGRALTLTEVMLAATLSVFVLAGILSTFLLIGHSGYSASSYSELEAQANRGLTIFAEDVRQASDIHWNNVQSITLTLPTATNATTLVTYAYDGDRGSSTYECFYRQAGAPAGGGDRQVLMRGVAADFSFHRYKIEQPGQTDNTATNDLETKQIQLSLRAVRSGATVVAATQTALSARFILRNKRVSN